MNEIKEYHKDEIYNKIFCIDIGNDKLSELIVYVKGCENSIYENIIIKFKLIFF